MYWTIVLVMLTSLVTTRRTSPSSASTPRTLCILATTCHRPPSPVSTVRTIEPEWSYWALRLLVRVHVAVVVVLVLVLVVVVVVLVVLVLLVAGVVVALLAGAEHRHHHHLQTCPAVEAACPVLRGCPCQSRSSLSCSSS